MTENPSQNILVVDDEFPIRKVLRTSLGSYYNILEAETGMEALKLVANINPDLVILDLGLLDMDGLEVLRRLREWTLVPVIIISVRDHEKDKVAALDIGADDYLIKPFLIGELMARIRAALRHCARPHNEPIFQNGNLMVDLSRRDVISDGKRVALTPIEYEILRALVTHAGKVLTHQQLIEAVWEDSNGEKAHLLRVNISNLRSKVELDPSRPQHIVTEPGVGYRLKEIEG